MGKIIPIGGIKKLDSNIKDILKEADHLNSVVLMGWDKNDELYLASSEADGAEILWLLEKLKKVLLEI